MRPLLGTYVEIGCQQTDAIAEHAIKAAFDTIETIHHLLSFHEHTSELSLINQAQGKVFSAHRHTLRVLKLAIAMTNASNGLFNCTVGNALIRDNILPNHDLLPNKTFPNISGKASDIQINGNNVRLRNGIKITLDGIAKGYAVDCAISVMKRYGIKAAWVNAGGDLRVYGDMLLPVQRREIDGAYVNLGGMQNAAIATSIVREQYNPSFPSKIFNTFKKPAVGSWTVMAQYAWRADALTKVACLADAANRTLIIQRLGGTIIAV